MTKKRGTMIYKKHISKMDATFEHDDKLGCITINIRYPYHIPLSRLSSKSDLLDWVLHLCEKNWMNMEYIAEFIEYVSKIKGWDPCLP